MKRITLVELAENKYNQLLTVLLLCFVLSPLARDNSRGSLVAFLILFAFMLFTIALVLREMETGKHTFNQYFLLAGLAFFLEVVSRVEQLPGRAERFLTASSTLIFAFFLWMSAYLVTREIFIAKRVTGDTIKGGICVFLILGFFWAGIYNIINTFDPNAFRGLTYPKTQVELVYFSFITLTTLGYGDIAPVSAFARMFSSLEAIAGVMYPSIFIARLVSLYSNERDRSP